MSNLDMFKTILEKNGMVVLSRSEYEGLKKRNEITLQEVSPAVTTYHHHTKVDLVATVVFSEYELMDRIEANIDVHKIMADRMAQKLHSEYSRLFHEGYITLEKEQFIHSRELGYKGRIQLNSLPKSPTYKTSQP
jgi:hypothetical protein